MTEYVCPNCFWTGAKSEMKRGNIVDEFWSNTFCPGCGQWHCLYDYNLASGDFPDEYEFPDDTGRSDECKQLCQPVCTIYRQW